MQIELCVLSVVLALGQGLCLLEQSLDLLDLLRRGLGLLDLLEQGLGLLEQGLGLLEQGLGLLDLLGQGLDLLSDHGWCLYMHGEACQESVVQLQKVNRFHMQYIVSNIIN